MNRERPGLQAWISFLRAHSALTRTLNAELVQRHDLTLNGYEVLLQLARAEDRRLRRVDLADRLVLTASGITRLLDGLERAGFVTKGRCESDGRVTYAVLTDKGLTSLEEASKTHLAGVGKLFERRFSEGEAATLVELLARLLPGSEDGGDCEPPG